MFAKYGPVLVGIPLLILGVLWTLSPSMAAEALTSELLTGAALTTQIGGAWLKINRNVALWAAVQVAVPRY